MMLMMMMIDEDDNGMKLFSCCFRFTPDRSPAGHSCCSAATSYIRWYFISVRAKKTAARNNGSGASSNNDIRLGGVDLIDISLRKLNTAWDNCFIPSLYRQQYTI